ncbi:hypothetical protein EW026_g202 [Hermanssonia centrifuga]|uniref:Uncharacterized protein n=1 Tax=Hermanssonia centrifuga TaxID=98765 RepID=A0A4S4KV97_9APHY|nr:hypothetical protein EW026_g202 [Hermanssonia centrifuga]
MAAVTLPLTFQNSFWSQNYRTGLEVLFAQLDKGVAENEDIVALIRTRAAAEAALAATLASPASIGSAFEKDEGASLLVAFRGIKEESLAQGQLHAAAAKDLQSKIADPFAEWANGYKERLHASRSTLVDGYLRAYEHAQGDVAGLKNVYVTKTHRADELEDDVRFAPISQPAGDTYTTSPNLAPRDKRLAPRAPTRQPTMSERISARLKEFRINAASPTPSMTSTASKPEIHFDADAEEKGFGTPKIDKGKGRAIDGEEPVLASPPPLSPPLPPAKLATNPVPPPPAPPIVVSGVSFTPDELSGLLARAKAELPLRPVRFPLLGEYQDAFTGEEFTAWLRENVKPFEKNIDRAEDAAKELVEKQGLLRRLGELGNEYEDADDAFYQFRPKAFNLEVPKPKDEKIMSPLEKNLSPLAENVVKRTSNFASLVTKALNNNPNGEAPYVKARREAEAADQEYRVAIRKLDRQRLGLEERIEDTLKTLQKWELDRLRAVKTVLNQYLTCLENLANGAVPSLEKSATLIASYQPESDLKAIIEQYRTGPFRPTAHVYESVAHDESDVVFGLDLRKWSDADFWNAGGGGHGPNDKKDVIPPVLTSLLGALTEAYAKLPNDAERRKTWVYEVPLVAVHHLRETLNAVPPMQDIPDDVLAKYDAPVIASALKLWVLELDPPLCMYEGWDEFRKLYPTVGAMKPEEQPSEQQHIQDLQTALQKLPRVHLIVLDTLVKHLKEPKAETKFSIQDRHPTLLFIDLVLKYTEILPPTIAKKKRESERKVPVRKHTRPMDMRMSRSRISAGADLKELHAQQLAQRGMKTRSPPPVPAIPANVAQPLPEPPVLVQGPVVSITAEPEEVTTAPVKEETAVVDVRAPTPVDFAKIPPPPPLSRTPTPKVDAPVPVNTEVPPAFKEPPPEDDDLPPRPQFKEPPPERSDSPPLVMPSFAEPLPSPTLPMPSFADPPPEPASPPADRWIEPFNVAEDWFEFFSGRFPE